MKAVIQRVTKADVEIKDVRRGSINQGLVILLGIASTDTEKDTTYLSQKILQLRIFEDEHKKMNRSIMDIGGDLLIVSQFTLLANCRKGRRPSFDQAAPPQLAKILYEKFIQQMKQSGLRVETGEFQAEMLVNIQNDGPVTLVIDSN
jgi:D-tyrosyl-tRNA(Tyr) deacylase